MIGLSIVWILCSEFILENTQQDEIAEFMIVKVTIPLDAFTLETQLVVKFQRLVVKADHAD